MRPTFVQLIVGFVLGAAVVASLALPGKFVIAKQPPMQELAVPRPPAPVVVEAAPIPRTRLPAPSRLQAPPPALSATPATSPTAASPSVAQTRPSPNPHAPPSQPGPTAEQSFSTLGTSSSEPENTRKDEKPKKQKTSKARPRSEKTSRPKKAKAERRRNASPRSEEAKKPKKAKTEKRPKPNRRERAEPQVERDKENRAGEKRAGPKDK